MCTSCWETEGRHSLVNDKTRAAAALIAELYERHTVGGYLHIVTDDYNIEQDSIDWCMGSSGRGCFGRPMDDVERRCGEALQDMTDEERGSAIAIWEGWV